MTLTLARKAYLQEVIIKIGLNIALEIYIIEGF
jgi:hypothetical protein